MRATIQNTSITAAGQLHEFDFVPFGRVDEGETGTIFLHVRAVGIFNAVLLEMFREILEVIDLEREMSEVGLDLDGTAGGEGADFDQIFSRRWGVVFFE